ncbi:SDR family NAD(P)-dependent oxidoreductase [Mycolicibacterium vinylchloridicum]|uniref:SDR family NAD(P)-dependent oxidoreductase n=1 Tax=Mycolicibacterium vinylchloridicum TaxID=2736928 RepID=UPI0015CD7606|nr:SDR family NAD(P)-dependent oxidoreductase [Mycolicibacterium vinylchloridicum]
MRYLNRVAVVTGAGSGIGRALTCALAREGARVAAADIDSSGLADTQALSGSDRVSAYPLDVTDRAAVLSFAHDVRRDLGCASLVFNNAGVDLYASAADMSFADFDWLMAINVGGVVNGTKAFLPQLIEAGSPQRPARLVNISSAFGLIAFAYQSAYSASKFAVRGFTEAVHQEMLVERHPVTVHSVHPGVVHSNFGMNMRTADTEDRGKAVQQYERAARTSPDKTAELILRGADRNRPRIVIGPDGWVAAALPRLIGVRYTGLMAWATRLNNRR